MAENKRKLFIQDKTTFWLSLLGIVVLGVITFFVSTTPLDGYDYWAKVPIHTSLLNRVLTLVLSHGAILALLLFCMKISFGRR